MSPTTVSHVISGKRPVSEALSKRVREAMAELGYAPMRSARNLALGRTQLIALLLPDIGNSFFSDLAIGVEHEASSERYNVVIANTAYEHDRALTHLELIRSRGVDGVVYSAGSPFIDHQISTAVGDLPLVLVDEEAPGTSAPMVVSDNRGGGVLAAEHLLSLGHRDVLVLRATSTLSASGLRADGFAHAWHEHGGHTITYVIGGFTTEGGGLAVRQHIADLETGRISAVFAVNDYMAIGALRELRSHQIDVPGRVSVVGFDDIRSAQDTVPALTTIRQDGVILGSRAARMLLAMLNTGNPPRESTVTLPVELRLRESTGPAPRAGVSTTPSTATSRVANLSGHSTR